MAPTWVVESICVVPCDHSLPNPILLSQPEVLDVTLILVPRQPVKLVTMEKCLEDGNVSQIETTEFLLPCSIQWGHSGTCYSTCIPS